MTYDVACPVCGRINRSLYLEETEGWMECECCELLPGPGLPEEGKGPGIPEGPEETDRDVSCSRNLMRDIPDKETEMKLDEIYPETVYVNPLMTHSWGQRVVRFYDPDGTLIEVGTPM